MSILVSSIRKQEVRLMDLNRLDGGFGVTTASAKPLSLNSAYVSLEAEIPEELYRGMKEFIGTNPNWDQYRLMSTALANFLFQNGCDDRAVTEQYLNDLFNKNEAA